MNWLQRNATKWLGLSYLVDAANYRERFRRPFEPLTTDTISVEVNDYDWQLLLSDSRKLYSNLGPVTGAIDDKATYSIGRAWNPKFLGQDRAWGKLAEDWLREMWYPMADIRRGMFDFKTDLFISSVSIDRDGEIYFYLTESADGWPQVQLFPAHMVGQRDLKEEIVQEGPYQGMRAVQGVILNEFGRAVAYNVLGRVPDEDQIISARDLIQVYDPKWADQVRGFPAFMHALLDLKDLRTVQGYEKVAAMLMSSVGIIEHNETGAPDMTSPGAVLSGIRPFVGVSAPSITTQEFNGGSAHFFRAGTGSKLESLKNERPGANVTDFMDRLIRNALTGAGWPYELTWDASKLGGANIRLLIAKAMRAVEDRQDLLRPVAKRVCGYAIAKAIKKGMLPPNDEWYRWGFGMPARMTADYGREAAADLNDLNAGVQTLSSILAEEGKDIDQHIQERKDDNEKLVAAGLPPIGQAEQLAADGGAPSETDVLKSRMDAYGVGVRAGAITPSKPDEAFFRKEAGLPPLNPDIDRAWSEDDNVRRPITLVGDAEGSQQANGIPQTEQDN